MFELFACESTRSEFDITMTEDMFSRLFDSNRQMDMEVKRSLDAIDCENSESFKKEDKERVFEVIRKSVGFRNLNIMVKTKVQIWLESQSSHGHETKREIIQREQVQIKYQ